MAPGAFARWIAAFLLLGTLVACGRAGDLEPPPSSTQVPASAEQPGDVPAPDEVEDRRFILDGLL